MSGWATKEARLPSLRKRQTTPASDASNSGRPIMGRASAKYATGSYPSIARPLKRLVTTRSVVPARAATPPPANSPRLADKRLASTAIKAIPGRERIPDHLPFLSCRCAVIVDTDNIRVGGHWAQPKSVLVSVRLRPRPGFQCPGVFHDFRLTPCSGDACRDDVLVRPRLVAAVASGGIAPAAAPAQPQYLRPGRTDQRRAPVFRQRIARPRLGDRARGQPMGPAERLYPRRGRLGRLCCRIKIWRGHALHQECRRFAGLLAGTVRRLRLGRRWRAHHDAGLQSSGDDRDLPALWRH